MLRGVEPYSYTSIAHIKLHIRRKNVHFCYSQFKKIQSVVTCKSICVLQVCTWTRGITCKFFYGSIQVFRVYIVLPGLVINLPLDIHYKYKRNGFLAIKVAVGCFLFSLFSHCTHNLRACLKYLSMHVLVQLDQYYYSNMPLKDTTCPVMFTHTPVMWRDVLASG